MGESGRRGIFDMKLALWIYILLTRKGGEMYVNLEEWMKKDAEKKEIWTNENRSKKPVAPSFKESGMTVEVIYTPVHLSD